MLITWDLMVTGSLPHHDYALPKVRLAPEALMAALSQKWFPMAHRAMLACIKYKYFTSVY